MRMMYPIMESEVEKSMKGARRRSRSERIAMAIDNTVASA